MSWHLAYRANGKFGLRPQLFCLRRHSRGTPWYDRCYRRTVVVDVYGISYECSVCSLPITVTGKALKLVYIFTSQFDVFSPLLRRIFTRELPVPGTSVSSVQPYQYPERLSVMYGIHTCTLSIFVMYVGHTHNHIRVCIFPGYYPTKNFCNFCRILISVLGTSGSSVRRCRKDPGYGVQHVYTRPELLEVLYDFRTRTRNFCEFCKTRATIPGVREHHGLYPPGTSVSYVCLCNNTRNLWKLCNTSIPVPETCGSYVRPPYPCPESTNPTELKRETFYTIHISLTDLRASSVFPHTSTFQLLDRSWSRISSLLPPASCLQFLSCIGFSNPTARRYHRVLLPLALGLSASQFWAQEQKSLQKLYTYVVSTRGDLNSRH